MKELFRAINLMTVSYMTNDINFLSLNVGLKKMHKTESMRWFQFFRNSGEFVMAIKFTCFLSYDKLFEV